MNIEKAVYNSLKYDIISFDVFDTLIERKVEHPTQIFVQVAEKYFSSDKEIESFKKHRILAEQEARRNSPNGEVNLNDIYNALYQYDSLLKQKLKQSELSTELDSCRPRNQYVKLFNRLKTEDKLVVLISDMYLSKETISKMLTKCGIEGYKYLFVSNECGCDKRSGKLFKYAQNRFNMSGKKQLHWGDSLKADVLGALKAGITPRLVLKKNIWKRLIYKFK